MGSATELRQPGNPSEGAAAAAASDREAPATMAQGAVAHGDAPQQQGRQQQQRGQQRQQQGAQKSSDDVDWWVQPGAGSSEDYSSEDEQALGLETAPPDFYDPAADEKVGVPVTSARKTIGRFRLAPSRKHESHLHHWSSQSAARLHARMHAKCFRPSSVRAGRGVGSKAAERPKERRGAELPGVPDDGVPGLPAARGGGGPVPRHVRHELPVRCSPCLPCFMARVSHHRVYP